jgi:hypothetical protein
MDLNRSRINQGIDIGDDGAPCRRGYMHMHGSKGALPAAVLVEGQGMTQNDGLVGESMILFATDYLLPSFSSEYDHWGVNLPFFFRNLHFLGRVTQPSVSSTAVGRELTG